MMVANPVLQDVHGSAALFDKMLWFVIFTVKMNKCHNLSTLNFIMFKKIAEIRT